VNPPAEAARHFTYYPGNYRWSAEMMAVLGTAPYGGADISEVDRMGRKLRERVGDDEAWFDVWCEGAELLRARATELAKKHPLTAASNYLRAAYYFQTADHFRQPKDKRALDAYQVSLDCFRRFAALNDSPRVEVVELPSKHGSFPAYFVHAVNSDRKKNPCVVRFGGFDTQKEMQYVRGTPDLVRRGVSYLLVDGPGQGEMVRYRNMYLRHDFEIAGSAAFDYLATRSDVDLDRVAIIAMSLGGYYAPRIAAMDKRYKACIAWGAIWDYHATWVKRLERIKQAALPVPADHLLWACGVDNYDDALKKIEGFKLDGVAQKVTCPFLLMHGAADAQVSMAEAQKLFDTVASKDKTFRVFTEEEGGAQHCQRDYVTRAVDVVADWIGEKFK
jgi:dienelactone hydrolase